MLLYLGISAVSNSVISSRDIVVIVPSVGGGWYNPIRCIGVLFAMVFHNAYLMAGLFSCLS